MSGRRLLLDSCILIDHFNGGQQATALLRERRSVLVVSAISRAEVLAGFSEEREPPARLLLDALPLLVVDAAAADLAARLRRERRWKLPDAFQAALSLLHGCTLVTRNTRDFDPARDSFVWVPYAGEGHPTG